MTLQKASGLTATANTSTRSSTSSTPNSSSTKKKINDIVRAVHWITADVDDIATEVVSEFSLPHETTPVTLIKELKKKFGDFEELKEENDQLKQAAQRHRLLLSPLQTEPIVFERIAELLDEEEVPVQTQKFFSPKNKKKKQIFKFLCFSEHIEVVYPFNYEINHRNTLFKNEAISIIFDNIFQHINYFSTYNLFDLNFS